MINNDILDNCFRCFIILLINWLWNGLPFAMIYENISGSNRMQSIKNQNELVREYCRLCALDMKKMNKDEFIQTQKRIEDLGKKIVNIPSYIVLQGIGSDETGIEIKRRAFELLRHHG